MNLEIANYMNVIRSENAVCACSVWAGEWSCWRRNFADGRRSPVRKRLQFTVSVQQRPRQGGASRLRHWISQRHLV